MMNPILNDYFTRIKSISKDSQIHYAVYERDPHSLMPFSIHLRFIDEDNRIRDSWGSGYDKDDAFGKALMEMIERLYFTGYSSFAYKKLFGFLRPRKDLFKISEEFNVPVGVIHPANTNGIAIHHSHQKALLSAMLELIERHVILFSLVSEIGPRYKIVKEITPGKKCSFYVWNGPLNTFTVVGSFTDEVGTYFSSGCDFNKEQALHKAELELNSFLFLKREEVPDTKIVKDDLQSINRYHKYSGDFSAIKFLDKLSKKDIPELRKDRFYFSDIPVPAIFQGLKKLPAVRVIHPDIQQLFFDNWDIKYLNPRIFPLNQILPKFPHIIA